MKRLWMAAMAVAAVVALAVSAVPPAVKAAGAAVYNLWLLDNGTMQVICTGTTVDSSDGPIFLAAGHCVAEAPKGRYYISQAAEPDYLVRVDLKWWEFGGMERWTDGDFAVFRLPKDFHPSTLPLCQGKPMPGDAVWAWTGPIGMLPILRTGVYSGELHFPDSLDDEAAIGGMGFVDIEGAPGSSGSSLLMEEGGRICAFGLWVGAFRQRPSGAIVSWLPPVLRP
jgi:hypothetical protein